MILYYLDSNIFILPVLYEGRRSTNALSVLKKMVTGKLKCATSSLTFDEITWIISRRHSREAALANLDLIMRFPHLKILEVRKQDVQKMSVLMRGNRNLAPREALHAAVAIRNNINMIISDDVDFSSIPGIDLIPLIPAEGRFFLN